MRIWTAVLLASLALCANARAADEQPPASVQFDQAYDLLGRADEDRDRDRLPGALARYREAKAAYENFSRTFPEWNPLVVRFRIAYCDNQIEALTARMATAKGAPEPRIPEAEPQGEGPLAPIDAASPAAADLPGIRARAAELLRGGQGAEARALLMSGMRASPDDPKVRLLIAAAQCQLGQFEDAAAICGQLTAEGFADAATHITMATACFGMGKPDEAIAALERALALDANSAAAHFNLAQALCASVPPQTEKARASYRRAIELGAAPDPYLDEQLGRANSPPPGNQ